MRLHIEICFVMEGNTMHITIQLPRSGAILRIPKDHQNSMCDAISETRYFLLRQGLDWLLQNKSPLEIGRVQPVKRKVPSHIIRDILQTVESPRALLTVFSALDMDDILTFMVKQVHIYNLSQWKCLLVAPSRLCSHMKELNLGDKLTTIGLTNLKTILCLCVNLNTLRIECRLHKVSKMDGQVAMDKMGETFSGSRKLVSLYWNLQGASILSVLGIIDHCRSLRSIVAENCRMHNSLVSCWTSFLKSQALSPPLDVQLTATDTYAYFVFPLASKPFSSELKRRLSLEGSGRAILKAVQQ